MKTRLRIALAVLATVALTASTTFAAGYDWRQKISYGNDPTRSSARTSRSYVARPYTGWRQAYFYQPAQVEWRQAFSYEPAAPTALKVGDTIVAPANVPLKVGDQVVTTVPQGQRITVSSVEGPWVGTSIEQNGRTIGGWALASELTGASPPYPARLPYYAARPVWSGGGCW